MTHVCGHVDYPNNSFGVVYPKKLKIVKKIETDDPEEGFVNFPILFANSSNGKFIKGNVVAFQPYLIPWEDSYLAIAGNVLSWKDHITLEKQIVDNKGFQSRFGKLEKLENLHDPKLDKKLRSMKGFAPLKLNKKQLDLFTTTTAYMAGDNFKKIYLDGKKIRSNNTIVAYLQKNTIKLSETGIFYTRGKGLSFMASDKIKNENGGVKQEQRSVLI
ncbi:MAG: hypothetical protein K2U26_07085 [Cyclobacteriaceae bacterium]|nr:hypothetical protein [Cyclobacteriaceae bacterium]